MTLEMIKTGLHLSSFVSERWTAKWAASLFLRPFRISAPPWEKELIQTATATGELGGLNWWKWGEGPSIMLVHGWSGRGAQLGKMIEPLRGAGFSVVTFDGIGHGASRGSRLTMLKHAESVRDMALHFGNVQGIVGHSFGGSASLYASKYFLGGLPTVTIAATTHIQGVFESFARRLDLSENVLRELIRLVEVEVGIPVPEMERRLLTPEPVSPLFVIHDEEDREVPAREAEKLARSHPHAQLKMTSKLGHYRILKSPEVTSEIVHFFQSNLQNQIGSV